MYSSLWLIPLAFLPEGPARALLLLSGFFLGMPHGGVDLPLGRRLGYPFWAFIAAYLALATLPLLLLFLSPPSALCAFLLLALYHWGRVEGRGPLGYLRAGMVLGFPFLFHAAEIRNFLENFSKGWSPPPWAVLLTLGLLLALSLLSSRPLGDWLDTFFLGFFLWLAHPYAGVAGYFLFQHSLRSLQLVGIRGGERREVYLATLGGLLLAVLLYPTSADPLAAYMGAVFALTLPHTLTMELWLRRCPTLDPPPGPSRRSPLPGR